MLEAFLDVVAECFESFPIVSKLMVKLKDFEELKGVQIFRGKLTSKQLFVVELIKHLHESSLSLRDFFFLQVIICKRGHLLFLNFLLYGLLGFEHDLIVADFESLTDCVIGLVAREEGSQEELAIYGCYRNRVVENDNVSSLLHLNDILFWNLDEGLSKKDVSCIELRIET